MRSPRAISNLLWPLSLTTIIDECTCLAEKILKCVKMHMAGVPRLQSWNQNVWIIQILQYTVLQISSVSLAHMYEFHTKDDSAMLQFEILEIWIISQRSASLPHKSVLSFLNFLVASIVCSCSPQHAWYHFRISVALIILNIPAYQSNSLLTFMLFNTNSKLNANELRVSSSITDPPLRKTKDRFFAYAKRIAEPFPTSS